MKNPPKCVAEICVLFRVSILISLLLALLLNTSLSFTLLCIICLVFYSGDTTRVLQEHAAYRKKPDDGEHETPRYHGV